VQQQTLSSQATAIALHAASRGVQFASNERPLAAEQASFFAEQGFLSLPEFCVEPELGRLRNHVTALFRYRVGHKEGRQFDMLGMDRDAARMTQPQILNPSLYIPHLLKSSHFKRMSAIAKQLLGPLAQFSFDHSILKPAGSRAATPWHQDEAHHSDRFFRYRQISFWMPLQDTPTESGCMRYIPRSHLGPLLPHGQWNGDARVHAIECDPGSFDDSAAVSWPASAGTCILHDGRTLHSALPNLSLQDRFAYIVAFIGPPLLRESSRAPTVSLPAARTASSERRVKWLLSGGVITVLARRIRLGLRSEPGVLAMKARLLLHSAFLGARFRP